MKVLKTIKVKHFINEVESTSSSCWFMSNDCFIESFHTFTNQTVCWIVELSLSWQTFV